MIQATNLVDILRWRAKNQPNRLAYRFLENGELEEAVLTYRELDQRARFVGGLLQSGTVAGDRALLLFPPGLDFISAFFGCLYGNVTAIPCLPPHPARIEKNLPIILRIIRNATPTIILLTKALYDSLKLRDQIPAEWGGIRFLVIDNPGSETMALPWEQPAINRSDLAFLQYTSGSTTTPRGVMISHGNLMHNMACIEKTFGVTENSRGVIWLPPYHDMGLIGGVLQPVYSGIPVTLMPHMMFIQNPLRWLQAISRLKGTVSGGPNFAYELCLKKITAEQRDTLDLSSWQIAFNGAEPVYYKTLEKFSAFFAPCGFRQEAFMPCYGLAESTLLVTGGSPSGSVKKQILLNAELERNKVCVAPGGDKHSRTLISCGQNQSDQRIRIVNPESLDLCGPDEVGEIWISGPSVTLGYWNNAAETGQIFNARLSGSEEVPYLRTGDLGFIKDEELYITGRIKNLIICEGKNHYAHDIERTVESAHPAIQQSGSAVFSVSVDGPERLIVVAEIRYRTGMDTDEIIRAIRFSVSSGHGLNAEDIRLAMPGGIPRTTSGKKKHFLCREYYLKGTLKEIA